MQDKQAERVAPVRVKASERHQRLRHSAAQNAHPVAEKTGSNLLPTPTVGAQDWYKDLLLSTLFRTCIKLQTQMDRRFRKARMTAQEAAVLVHCVASRQTSPGALAHVMGRDKGKVTRFIQRLVARGLLKREVKLQDRPSSWSKSTYVSTRLSSTGLGQPDAGVDTSTGVACGFRTDMRTDTCPLT
jgi:hypothetical protein